MAGVTAVRLWKPSPGLRTKPATNRPQGSGTWQRRQVCGQRPCAGRGRPWDDPRTSVPPTRGPCGWRQVASDRSLRVHTRSRGAKPAAHIQACRQLSWNPVNVTGFNTRCSSSRGCVRDKRGRRSHLIRQQQGSLVPVLPGSPGPGSAPASPPPPPLSCLCPPPPPRLSWLYPSPPPPP